MSDLRLRKTLTAFSVALGVFAAAVSPAAALAPAKAPTTSGTVSPSLSGGPFTEPGFAGSCVWHSFGEGVQPPWWLAFADPLCVEYSKRDITFDDGGALTFLIAEPSRVALSLVTCHYYQKDHWSVQPTTGVVPWVTWDGQYWWDKTAQRAGIRLTNFRINSTPVGIGDAVAALRLLFPDVADALAAYGGTSGESGFTTALPFDLRCALSG
ncbi:hypothetical protein [Streptomyces sp. NPDC057909]|uniref:hypothetical protein n=1 Tax=Streptomyces sp. NPDC057909 TaxID=3346277 RepID=UPI0036EB3DCF